MATNGGLTRRLAEFYAALDYESLPPQVIDRAKYFCLDYLGTAIRGSLIPSAQVMSGVVGALGAGGDSVIMGTSLQATPEYAALANGTAAHSLELDDVSNSSSSHPAVATFPAAFASADMEVVSGSQLITAVTAGYDLMIRLGMALDPSKHYARGFHPTATCGTFGAALVASRLLRLDAGQTTWALGIAGSQAAGSLEFLAQGAWTKRMHPGWAAHSGMIAAHLAKAGFIGPTTIFEGRDGFLHGYTDGADASKLTQELGDVYHISKVSIKPHACCRYKQGPIDALLEVVRQHDVNPEEVDSVTVGVLKAGFNVVAEPREQKLNPQNIVDAQFSMPFGAALAILYRRASLEEYTEENLERPEIKELMSRVECVQDPALDARYPSRWPAWGEVKTRDGRSFRAEVEYPRGDPENALTWDEVKDKFRVLTVPVISPQTQEKIVDAVDSLEQMEDVRVLARMAAVSSSG